MRSTFPFSESSEREFGRTKTSFCDSNKDVTITES